MAFDFTGGTTRTRQQEEVPKMFDFTGGAPKAQEEVPRMFDFTGGANMLTLEDMASKPKAGGLTLEQMAAPRPREQQALSLEAMAKTPAKATSTPPLPMPTPRIAGGELVSGGPRRGDAFMKMFSEGQLSKAVTKLFHPEDKIAMPRPEPDYMSKDFEPRGAGEWLPYIAGAIAGEAPTIAAAYATGGVAGAGALAGLGAKVPKLANVAKAPLAKLGARGVGAGVAHGAMGAAVEGVKGVDAAKRIALEAAIFGIGDPVITKGAQVAGRAIGKGVQAYKGSLEAPALQGLDLTKPAQLKMLPPPPTQAALPPGSKGLLTGPDVVASGGRVGPQKALPATSEELITRQYANNLGLKWPLDTQGKATVQLHRALDDVRQSVMESTVPPLESRRQLVNFVHDGLGGEISKTEIRKLPHEELADMAQLVAKNRSDLWQQATREAGKKGIDLDDLHRTATDPEYARWKDVTGLGGEKPPLIPKPYQHEAELEAARSILKKTKDIGRAAKILETYPQLKPEFRGWVGRINHIGAKRETATMRNAVAAAKSPAVRDTLVPPQGAQDVARRVKVNTMGYTIDDSRSVAEAALEGIDVAGLKDVGPIKAQAMDLSRLVYEVFGGGSQNIFKGKTNKVKELLLDPLDRSKGQMAKWEEQQLTALRENVVAKGIRMNSKESAILQRFGEKNMTLDELQAARPKDWRKFVEAEQWFRRQYDDQLDRVNAVYREVYGHDPKTLQERLIPKRQDYFRHMIDDGDFFMQMRNMFTTAAEITPQLVRVTDQVRPRSKWLSIAQQRKGGEYTEDAVAGYINYLRQSGYHLHVTPHINRLKEFGKLLAERTGETEASKGNLNKFINVLTRHEQSLAGKTHAYDRPIQEVFGRENYRLVNILNNRVRANMIVWSANTLVAQTTHAYMAAAVGKAHVVPGLKNTVKSLLGRWQNDPMKMSDYMRERYKEKIFRQFETKPIRKFVAKGGQILEDFDRFNAIFVWQTMYQKGLGMGKAGENAVKYADDATRAITAGRGIGERAYYQQAQITQLIAPFQVEVGNIALVHRDLWKGDKAGLMVLFMGAWLSNRIYEATRGSALLPDPIQAIADAVTEIENEDRSAGEKAKRVAGRFAGEVISSIPFGQHIGAAAVPDPSDRKELFGRKDPTRYGTGIILSKPWQSPTDAATFLLPPAGGLQIKRTVEGIGSMRDGGVHTESGNLMFPIEATPNKAIKSAIFGKYSSPEAREYFDKNRRPLSEKQTEEFKQRTAMGEDPKRVYTQTIKAREIAAIERKLNEVFNDASLTVNEKIKRVRKLNEQRMELMRGGL